MNNIGTYLPTLFIIFDWVATDAIGIGTYILLNFCSHRYFVTYTIATTIYYTYCLQTSHTTKLFYSFSANVTLLKFYLGK